MKKVLLYLALILLVFAIADGSDVTTIKADGNDVTAVSPPSPRP